MSQPTMRMKDAVIAAMIPRLESEGYSVFLQPSQAILPPFLDHLSPDAIAYRGDRKVALEVISGGRPDTGKVKRIQEAIAAHPDWELRLVYAPTRPVEPIPTMPEAVIVQHLDELGRDLADGARPVPAFLVAWSILEAAVRRAIPASGDQGTASLLETLAYEGFVTPDQADRLRQLYRLRNELSHGGLEVPVTPGEVGELMTITREILAVDA